VLPGRRPTPATAGDSLELPSEASPSTHSCGPTVAPAQSYAPIPSAARVPTRRRGSPALLQMPTSTASQSSSCCGLARVVLRHPRAAMPPPPLPAPRRRRDGVAPATPASPPLPTQKYCELSPPFSLILWLDAKLDAISSYCL
jgi:hypothetical protein